MVISLVGMVILISTQDSQERRARSKERLRLSQEFSELRFPFKTASRVRESGGAVWELDLETDEGLQLVVVSQDNIQFVKSQQRYVDFPSPLVFFDGDAREYRLKSGKARVHCHDILSPNSIGTSGWSPQ